MAGVDFIWTIENYSFYPHDEHLESPEFVTNDGTHWQIDLYPSNSHSKNITCYLWKLIDDVETTSIRYQINLLNSDGLPFKTPTYKENSFTRDSDYVGENLIKQTDLTKHKKTLLPRDTMMIQCKVLTSESVTSSENHGSLMQALCVQHQARTHVLVEKFSFLHDVADTTKVCMVPITCSNEVPLLEMTISTALVNRRVSIMFRRLHMNRKMSIYALCKVSLLDSQLRSCYSEESKYFFSKHLANEIWQLVPISINNILTTKRVSQSSSTDLQLRFEFSIYRGVGTTFIENWNSRDTTRKIRDDERSIILESNLLSLYTEQKFCDCIVESRDGKTFPAHKSLLGIRSPVFRRLFEQNSKERDEIQVYIKDVDSETLELISLSERDEIQVYIKDVDSETLDLMLKYIYSAMAHGTDWDHYVNLYFAADRYELVDLKKECAIFLERNLTSPGRICQVLCLADDHKDIPLKNAVREILRVKMQEVFSSPHWYRMTESHVKLCSETLQYVSKIMGKNLMY